MTFCRRGIYNGENGKSEGLLYADWIAVRHEGRDREPAAGGRGAGKNGGGRALLPDTGERGRLLRRRGEGKRCHGHQLFIDLYAPGRIVNVGVAGCFENVPIGTLVLADRFMQHDVDTSGIGDPVGLVSTVNRIDFPTAELEKAKDAMDKAGYDYRVGSVATGEWFATECDRARWIAETFHPLLIEMEGGAAAQVCYRNEVPFMALKSVSDCVLEHHDFYFNFPEAMKDLNRVAMAFLDGLEG